MEKSWDFIQFENLLLNVLLSFLYTADLAHALARCTSHSKWLAGGGSATAPRHATRLSQQCRSLTQSGRLAPLRMLVYAALSEVLSVTTAERAKIRAVGYELKMSSITKRPRCVCTFTDVLKQRFPIMKDGREPTEVFCSICNNYFSIKFKGPAGIEKHILTEKHEQKGLTVSSNTKIDSLLHSQSSGQTDKISAIKAILAFHTVKHNQSFKSMDCTSQPVTHIMPQ